MRVWQAENVKSAAARPVTSAPRALAVLAAAIVGGCAAGSGTSIIETGSVGQFATDGSYRLSSNEQALDCRRITGRMQVRILQVRDRMERKPSLVTRLRSSLQGLGSDRDAPTLGSEAATERDLAILKAYNRQLAAKSCPTFDLGAELKPHDVSHTPRPSLRRANSGN